jgi:hypothetical protein
LPAELMRLQHGCHLTKSALVQKYVLKYLPYYLENKPEWLSDCAMWRKDSALWQRHSATPAYFPNNTVGTLLFHYNTRLHRFFFFFFARLWFGLRGCTYTAVAGPFLLVCGCCFFFLPFCSVLCVWRECRPQLSLR